MLTRDQRYTLGMLYNRGNTIFSALPVEIIQYISGMDNPDSEINRALREAALGEQANLDRLVEMVGVNPRLLLQAGNVVTRGGTKIIRTTLYEFFLGSGYPEAAELIAPYFSKIVDEEEKPIGEAERVRQYERYRPHIEQLRKDVEAYQAAYEAANNSAYNSTYEPDREVNPSYHLIKPLIDLIIGANRADVTAELDQTRQSEGYETPLRQDMEAFRKAIDDSQRYRTEGMHYAHYTTIMQVLDLLYEKWPELSADGTNHDKCRLVFSQVFAYLQLVGLPARERMAFADAFDDSVLSLEYKYQSGHRFPDVDFSNLVRSGLGFSFGIIGWPHVPGPRLFTQGGCGARWPFSNHMLSKNSTLLDLMHTPPTSEKTPSRCVLL